jgi:ATP-dependent DNA ligase
VALYEARHALAFTNPSGRLHRAVPSHLSPPQPSGETWLHEIKHNGFRVIARKDDKQVKLYSRPGNDLTRRFPLIVEAMAILRCGNFNGTDAKMSSGACYDCS